MMSKAKVLVIIVTWNKKNYVINLLDSLSAIDFPRDSLEIIVVDNASNDGTVEAIKKQFSDIHIIQNQENLGGTGGFNSGLAWAFNQTEDTYDYLWLLDNDVVVHQRALTELVDLLQHNPDAAIAGSTMLQLDYPCRINEMGAFVDRNRGTLLLNKHMHEVPGWREKQLAQLLCNDGDLSTRMEYCQPFMDVDYVAAASLLIRAPLAKQAGLWLDFFIHYDDVEWCLRIAKMKQRILVSARSLIWHLSAVAKVPSWILYYDNRNVLYLLEKHGDKHAVKNTLRWILKKALYYGLIGKRDLAELHLAAIADYRNNIHGKKDIKLTDNTFPLTEIAAVFSDPNIKSIIIPWTLNLQAANIQTSLAKVMQQRKNLTVYHIPPPAHISHLPQRQLPGSVPFPMPRWKVFRYLAYFRQRGNFDMALQSDYQAIIPLSWVAKDNLFVNYENFCRRPGPTLKDLWQLIKAIIKHR